MSDNNNDKNPINTFDPNNLANTLNPSMLNENKETFKELLNNLNNMTDDQFQTMIGAEKQKLGGIIDKNPGPSNIKKEDFDFEVSKKEFTDMVELLMSGDMVKLAQVLSEPDEQEKKKKKKKDGPEG